MKYKKKLSFFALITARGGSMGIKNKNLKNWESFSFRNINFECKKVKNKSNLLFIG